MEITADKTPSRSSGNGLTQVFSHSWHCSPPSFITPHSLLVIFVSSEGFKFQTCRSLKPTEYQAPGVLLALSTKATAVGKGDIQSPLGLWHYLLSAHSHNHYPLVTTATSWLSSCHIVMSELFMWRVCHRQNSKLRTLFWSGSGSFLPLSKKGSQKDTKFQPGLYHTTATPLNEPSSWVVWAPLSQHQRLQYQLGWPLILGILNTIPLSIYFQS